MIKPIKSGHQKYGIGTLVWQVFSTAQAEAEVGWVADDGNTEFAERLTGKRYFAGDVVIALDPEIKVFGKKLIVSQIISPRVYE
jgi:hypothetical protein